MLNNDHFMIFSDINEGLEQGLHLKFFKTKTFKFCNSIPLKSIIADEDIQSAVVSYFYDETYALQYENKIKLFNFE